MPLSLIKKESFKASLIFLVLIGFVYFPTIFCGKTLSAAARYPWFQQPFLSEVSILPAQYPNIFNVDLGTPAAFEEPIDIFIGNQLRKGIFPLWNPFLACGTVVQEQFSTRSLFPYQLLQNFCPYAWRDFFLLGRLFFAALGVFILLKILGLKFYPALCGGIIYGFGGSMTVFLNLTQASNVGMVLPYALIGSELFSWKQSSTRLIFYSIIIALLILAGQPEVSFYGLLLIFCYGVFRILTVGQVGGGEAVIKKIGYLILGLCLGLFISSPFFLPFLTSYDQYYHLHPPGGAIGIGTPTPPVNFWAIFLPELLRWRSEVNAFTVNAGWDCLGGYAGISSTIIVVMVFMKKWWGRKAYLFFLFWSILILTKNMGLPVVAWIGRLPLFDQVWTPRWAGVTWNLSWALATALGLEALFYCSNENSQRIFPLRKINQKLRFVVQWVLVAIIILFISFYCKVVDTRCWNGFSFYQTTSLLIFLTILSGIFLFFYLRESKLSWFFLILSLLMAWGVSGFELQLLHIEGNFKFLPAIEDKLVRLSMKQSILVSIVLGLGILWVFARTFKNWAGDKERFIQVIVGVIIIETMFHITLGYDEIARFNRLFLYLIGLFYLGRYPIFLRPEKSKVELRIVLCLFLVAAVLLGLVGLSALPDRKDVFNRPLGVVNDDRLGRVMGIRGLLFPNSSAALGIQDIKSIESLSLKRFQLFRDYCLLIRPQSKYNSLWFTGILDPDTGSDIADNIKAKYSFYALAGINNYLSLQYEDIPYTRLISEGTVKNYQNLAVMPRAFIVYRWEGVASAEDALSWMLEHGSLLSSQAVVESKNDISSESTGENIVFTPVKIKAYELHSVIIEALLNKPGLLILTDTYHPNWRVIVDGKPGEIFPANLCFRGVFLDKGEHVVKFIYFPKVFYISIAISVSILLVFIFYILFIVLKARVNEERANAKHA